MEQPIGKEKQWNIKSRHYYEVNHSGEKMNPWSRILQYKFHQHVCQREKRNHPYHHERKKMGRLNGFFRTIVHATHTAFAAESPERPAQTHFYRPYRTIFNTYSTIIACIGSKKCLRKEKTTDQKISKANRCNGNIKWHLYPKYWTKRFLTGTQFFSKVSGDQLTPVNDRINYPSSDPRVQ